MEQALELDQVLLVHSQFVAGKHELNLNWTLLFIQAVSRYIHSLRRWQLEPSGLN